MHRANDQLQLSPSDITGFLACEHLTTLSLGSANGEIERPAVANPQADLIRRKGDEHERGYLLATLRAQYANVREIQFDGRRWDEAQQETIQALQDGVDVIFQGVFSHGS